MVTRDEVMTLGQVMDPEIHRPITDLDMVKDVSIDPGGLVTVEVLLTVAGCPLKDRITKDVTAAVSPLPGVTGVKVDLGVMTEDQRQAMVTRLRGPGAPSRKRSPSGATTRPPGAGRRLRQGGVGKSSVTVNLAAGLAAQGHRVAVIDCDIYGFSVPRMLGATGQPVGFNGMIMPLEAHGVRVISIGFFLPPGKPVAWRGPMLHRAIQQFLTDVYWGDLDYVLADLPPGTGDVSISLAQMLPGPDAARHHPGGGRAGGRAGRQLRPAERDEGHRRDREHERFVCPSCDERHQIFGSGGGGPWPASSAPPCSARSRSTCACARAPTRASRWSSRPDAPASRALSRSRPPAPLPRSLVGKRLTLLT